MPIYQSSSSTATKKLGRELARKIIKEKNRKGAVVVALIGGLGGGKTTFTQGFASGLGIRNRVSSPTFILMRNTELKKLRNSKFGDFIHIDAYRAEPEDFLKLGFKKIAADPKNVILVEWADKLKKILPRSATVIRFEHGKKENDRAIIMNNEL